MSIKVKNLSNKVIGFGEVNILPGETREIPQDYERNPAIDHYQRLGLIKCSGNPTLTEEEMNRALEEQRKVQEEAEKKAAEELKKERTAILQKGDAEEVASLAMELGINPADCKDQADVVKKVKAALK